MRELYILLFNELFITGKYDDLFMNKGITMDFWEYVKTMDDNDVRIE